MGYAALLLRTREHEISSFSRNCSLKVNAAKNRTPSCDQLKKGGKQAKCSNEPFDRVAGHRMRREHGNLERSEKSSAQEVLEAQGRRGSTAEPRYEAAWACVPERFPPARFVGAHKLLVTAECLCSQRDENASMIDTACLFRCASRSVVFRCGSAERGRGRTSRARGRAPSALAGIDKFEMVARGHRYRRPISPRK